MVPLILIGATVLDGCLVFGYGSFVVGFFLMAVRALGLIAFMSTRGTVLRPGEREAVVEDGTTSASTTTTSTTGVVRNGLRKDRSPCMKRCPRYTQPG
ncbi:hypothetical protein [Streptomyces mirabilis]|uniref:hypothetical protein n=1 Tax=Streptomyces mirabilis TaxID=68239 RepID=UPI00365C78FE